MNYGLLQEVCRVLNSINLSGMWDFHSEYRAQSGNSDFFSICVLKEGAKPS